MKEIIYKHAHIEIKPYIQGDCIELEHALSTWDKITYKYNPLGYIIHNGVLYLPRGVNELRLDHLFDDYTKKIDKSYDPIDNIPEYDLLYEPRNEIQTEAVDFLNSTGNFKRTRLMSQLSLNLDTGDGKTYCAIHNIIKTKVKAIIITHADKIKKQWYDSIIKMTTLPEENIVDITGSDIMNKILDDEISGEIYLVNHQTIQSFLRNNDYNKLKDFFIKIRVGLKIYDEAHLEFKNILLMDFFSDTRRTIYITATFSRSDVQEHYLFDRVFSSVYRFGMETRNYECKRKHIIYLPVFFRSPISELDALALSTNYGFSANRYIDYALKEDSSNSLLKELEKVLDKVHKLSGSILITVPKIESVDIVYDFVKEYINDDDIKIGKIYSKNTPDINLENKCSDIIISTIKSTGTGTDIYGLRVIINLEPFSSDTMCDQLSGRLREFDEKRDTYFFDLIDISIKQCDVMYKKRLTRLRKKVKKVIIESPITKT